MTFEIQTRRHRVPEGTEAFRRHPPHREVVDVAGAGPMVVGDRNDASNEGVIGFWHRHHRA